MKAIVYIHGFDGISNEVFFNQFTDYMNYDKWYAEYNPSDTFINNLKDLDSQFFEVDSNYSEIVVMATGFGVFYAKELAKIYDFQLIECEPVMDPIIELTECIGHNMNLRTGCVFEFSKESWESYKQNVNIEDT